MSEQTHRHRGRTLLWLVLSAVIGVPVFFALYSVFDLFGLAVALGLLVVVGLTLLITWLVHLLRTFGPEIGHTLRSIGSAIGQQLNKQPSLARLGERIAPIGRFARRRLDPSTSRGLFLTGGTLVSLGLIWAFASLWIQVAGHGVLPQVDVRVANLSNTLHRGGPVRASTFFTRIGGASVRIPLTILVFGVLWFRKPSLRPAIGLVAVLVLAPAGSDLVRIIVGRPRPPVGAAALPNSSSFPSGHAAGAAGAFAFLAYLAVRTERRLVAQAGTVLLGAVVILGVAYSRVILGFHWASDVAAGTVFGLAVANAAATWVDVVPWRAASGKHGSPARWICGSAAIALVAFTFAGAMSDPAHAPTVRPPALVTLPGDSVDAATIERLPLRSETLTGREMEPVSLIFIGTREQIQAAFQAAGWSEADPVNIHTLLRLSGAGLFHRSYPEAPVTPAFLAGRPQDLAFELPVTTGSVSQRHHTRIWGSGLAVSDGTPIWVATASLDDRVEVTFPSLLPTHHIAPAIDLERDFIARGLLATGLVSKETRVQAVPPELGTNAAGDPFFTYGQAVVIDLR